MADPRQWRDISSTTRYPFLPSSPESGDVSRFVEGVFADIQACCPGGQLFLSEYFRTTDDGIFGLFSSPSGWTASFGASNSDLHGGWTEIREVGTGHQAGVVVFCEKAYKVLSEVSTSPNTVNAEVIPSLLSSGGGVLGLVSPQRDRLCGDVIIETHPDGNPEGVFIETDGGVDPVLVVSAAGVQDTTPCGKTALRSINGITVADSFGELIIQSSTGTGTGVLRIIPRNDRLTFKLETS